MALPSKATHQQTRVHNERLVVRTVYDLGPISRADVARQTGLTRTTVSDVVTGLLDEGVVREIGRGPSSGGKAPILLEVDQDARLVIGLDLGEEHFAGSLVNLRGEIRRTVELPVAGRDGDDAVQLVYRPPRPAARRHRRPAPRDRDRDARSRRQRSGTIRRAVNLDWRDLPLGTIVGERYGVPVNVANDSQAAALAEYTFAGGERVPEPDRDPRRARRRCRPDPPRRAVPGRRLGRRRDRPHGRRRRRRALPLRPDRLSRDGRRACAAIEARAAAADRAADGPRRHSRGRRRRRGLGHRDRRRGGRGARAGDRRP